MLKMVCRGGAPAWPRPQDMPEALWRLLAARGVGDARAADAFLHPSTGQLIDPYALSRMEEAASRIRRAVASGEHIWIWGDYDVDGVCATAILSGALRAMGARPKCYLPSRHREGYGLNEAGLREIAPDGGLLVTVDCGVSALDMVALAQEIGLSVIVTDHHLPGDALPDCPVVNPQLNGYPNPALCGAGVAFKLAMALCPQAAMECIDLAALATVADVVSLLGENRAIVALGLDRMNREARPGIRALCQAAGLSGPIGAGHLGFQLGPRLNAGGRVGSARQALDLLLADTLEEALPIAQALEKQNQARRDLETKIVREAEAQVEQIDLSKANCLVLAGDWNVGVVGLAASRLVEKYHMPCVLLAEAGETLTGSCRSIPGADIFSALGRASDLLIRFGGHRQAAGLTLARENLAAFKTRLDAAIGALADPAAFIPSAEYDLDVPLHQVDRALVEALGSLEPCGFGNPAPVLRCRATIRQTRRVGKEGAHLSFCAAQGAQSLRGIWFSQGAQAPALEGACCDLLFAPGLNAYMNRVSVQLQAKAAAPALPRAALCPDADAWEALLHAFLTQRLYNEVFPGKGTWTAEELAEALKASPRGVLVLAASPEAAQALWDRLTELGAPAPDVYAGRFPDDRRAWNALCLLPAGPIPEGYERAWCLGAPGWLMAPGMPALETGPRAAWMNGLPDTAALRNLYVAARDALSARGPGVSARAFCRALGEKAALSPAAALSGLMALSEMDLVTLRDAPFFAAMRPARRASPEESTLFQKMRRLRGWEADADDRAGSIV